MYPWTQQDNTHQSVIKANEAVRGIFDPQPFILYETPHFRLIKFPAVILSEGSRTGRCAPLATVNLRDGLHFQRPAPIISCVGALVTSRTIITLLLSALNCLSWFCTPELAGFSGHTIPHGSQMESVPIATLVIFRRAF